MKRLGLFPSILISLLLCAVPVHAKIVVALTPLSVSDGYANERDTVSQVMQAELSQSTNLTLVDRDQLNKALDELKLAQQGLVPADSARQLGKIVGARSSGSVEQTNSFAARRPIVFREFRPAIRGTPSPAPGSHPGMLTRGLSGTSWSVRE